MSVIVAALLLATRLAMSNSNGVVADGGKPGGAEWPPRKPALMAGSETNTPGMRAGIDGGSLSIRIPAAPHYRLLLITATFFDEDKFVGVTQRFEEEQSAHDSDSRWKIPEFPKEANHVVITASAYGISETQKSAGWFSDWYKHTWSHFTTATYLKDGWEFRIWKLPTDTDLPGWLRSNGIEMMSTQSVAVDVPLQRKGEAEKK